MEKDKLPNIDATTGQSPFGKSFVALQKMYKW